MTLSINFQISGNLDRKAQTDEESNLWNISEGCSLEFFWMNDNAMPLWAQIVHGVFASGDICRINKTEWSYGIIWLSGFENIYDLL